MLLTGVIVAAIMIVAADVLIPLALATLLSFVLAIPVRALQRLRLPRPLAVVAVVLAAFGAIFAFGQILAQEVSDLTDRLPQYEAAIGQKIDALEGLAAKRSVTLEPARRFLKTLDREFQAARRGSSEPDVMTMPTARGLVPRRASDMLGLPVDWLVAIVSPLVEPLASASLSFIFVVFILIQREDLRNRFIRLAEVADIPHTTMALDDAARRLSRLFLAQLVINATYGALIGLGLSLIGVPSAFVWGVLTGALRFVPFVGPVLGLIFPLTLAIAVGSGWSMAFWTVALYAGLESVTGEVVEPLFEGRTAGLTPVAIVVAAIFWWWIWGPIGLVMATPLTVVLVALGRHFEALKPFDILLGDRPALSAAEAFYQSMVAGNLMEAIAEAKAFMATRTLSDYCDAVVRPALMLAHEDFRRGALEGETLGPSRRPSRGCSRRCRASAGGAKTRRGRLSPPRSSRPARMAPSTMLRPW